MINRAATIKIIRGFKPNKTLQPTVKRFTIFAKNAKAAPLLPAAELGVRS